MRWRSTIAALFLGGAALYFSVGTRLIDRLLPDAPYAAPRLIPLDLATAGRNDLLTLSPPALAKRLGFSPSGPIVGDSRLFYDKDIFPGRRGQPLSLQFFYSAKPIGAGVCQISQQGFVLKDTFVVPVGWRLTARQEWLPRALYGFSGSKPPTSGRNNCSTFSDFYHLFSASDEAAAIRGARLLRGLIETSRASNAVPMVCYLALDSDPGTHPQTCDAASTLRELLSWRLAAVIAQEPGGTCNQGSEDVLAFQDPARQPGQYTVKNYDVHVCSAPIAGTRALVHILSVRIERDDIA